MKRNDLRHSFVALLRVKAPLVLVLVLAAIHWLVELQESSEKFNAIYQILGLQWETFKTGRVWQIWTYGFLHGGFIHLGVNAIGIVLIGSRVEQILGSRGFLRICFLGVLGGGIAHLLVAPSGESAPILVGFSAAVMALVLLMTTLSPDSRMWPLPVSGRALGLGILSAEGILALIDPALGLPVLSQIGLWISKHGGTQWFEIAHGCHFGGGLVGWMYGRWILRQRVTQKNLRRARERREVD